MPPTAATLTPALPHDTLLSLAEAQARSAWHSWALWPATTDHTHTPVPANHPGPSRPPNLTPTERQSYQFPILATELVTLQLLHNVDRWEEKAANQHNFTRKACYPFCYEERKRYPRERASTRVWQQWLSEKVGTPRPTPLFLPRPPLPCATLPALPDLSSTSINQTHRVTHRNANAQGHRHSKQGSPYVPSPAPERQPSEPRVPSSSHNGTLVYDRMTNGTPNESYFK